MDHFTLSLAVGAVAGTLDIIPMIFQRLPLRSCLSAFFIYFFAAVIVFYSNLPYLPWWADGMAVTLMLMLPRTLHLLGQGAQSHPGGAVQRPAVRVPDQRRGKIPGLRHPAEKKRDGIRFFTYSMQYQAISPFIKRKRTEKRQR